MPWPYDDEEQLRMAQAMRGGQVPPQQLVQPQQAQAGNAGPSPPFGSMPLPGPGGSARMGPAPPAPTPGADLVKGVGKAAQIVMSKKGADLPDTSGRPDVPLSPGAPPPGIDRQQVPGVPDSGPLPNPQLRKFAGYFAQGGPVAAQRPVVVGERGPEMFVPRQPGYIVPNQGQPALPPGYMPPEAMGNGRAYGGEVDPDQPYTVGEQGPETFIPQQNQSGYVAHPSLPAGQTSGKAKPQQPAFPPPPTPVGTNYGNPASAGLPAVQQGPNYANETFGGRTDLSAPALPSGQPPRMAITSGVVPGQQGALAQVPPGTPDAQHIPRMPMHYEAGQLDPSRGRLKRGIIGAGIGAMSGAQGGLPGIIGGAAAGGIISAASRTGAGNIAREALDIPQQDRRDARAHAATQEELKEQMQRAQIGDTEARGGLARVQTTGAQQNIDIRNKQAPIETAGMQLQNDLTAANTAYKQGQVGREETERKEKHGEFEETRQDTEKWRKTEAANSAAGRGITIAEQQRKAAEDLRVQQEGDINNQAQMHATASFDPAELRRMQVDSIKAAQRDNGTYAAEKELADIDPNDITQDGARRDASARHEKLRAEGANIGNANFNAQMARWVQMYRNEIKQNGGTVPDLHGKQFNADQVNAIANQRGNSWDDQARILRHWGADVMDPGNVPHVAPAKSWWQIEQEEDEKQQQKDAEERKAKRHKPSTGG